MNTSIRYKFDYKTAQYIPIVLIMCGPPASGKSTFIKKNVPKTFTLLSRDYIRNFFYGRKYKPNNSAENAVTYEYNRLLQRSINYSENVVIDKTNCDQARFDAELKIFEEKSYVIYIKFFDVSYRTLIFREIKRRLTDRSKPSIPFKIIKNMKTRYDKIDKSKYAQYILY